MTDRLAHLRERGKVKNAIESLRYDALDGVEIVQVDLDEAGVVGHCLTMPPFETVEHRDLVTFVEQLAADDRPDVAGGAGDQQPQRDWARDPVNRSMRPRDSTDIESRAP